MAKFVIRGEKQLNGVVKISGSKNAALPLMTASILTDQDVVLRNIPDLLDVRVLIELLEILGKEIMFEGGVLTIKQGDNINTEAPYELVNKMRASIIVLGPLLARYKKAKVSIPGGCAFGPRPIDLHIKGLKNLGARIDFDHGDLNAVTDGLVGRKMTLLTKFGSSVLGTDNVMMAATLAEGQTIIEGAAREPECVDLANMLVKMGADIEGAGTSMIKILGVEKLSGVNYTVIPDRIEAGTFMVLPLITGGSIELENINPTHLNVPIEILGRSGASIEIGNNRVKVSGEGLRTFSINTRPYPGFPTDLQPVFTTLALFISGTSFLTEGVYPDRFSYVAELERMGAKIEKEMATIVVYGDNKLTGAPVKSLDLRAGAAMVLVGLGSQNTTEVYDIDFIDRGYERFEEKLRGLGADIIRKE